MHPKAQTLHPRISRVYVTVNTNTDPTGYVEPRAITWPDGRTFEIERVRDFRPADTIGLSLSGDCYTVIIRGQEKHLFYEKLGFGSRTRQGRWFVETVET
ncbi:MAG: hypothetical protein LUC27_06535 [Lachnospiraceae bacterium]|nr:hypothetical protein [Lachnospiraceae bacterium]